jgi:hypothetical protein
MWVDGNGIFFLLYVARLPEVKENVLPVSALPRPTSVGSSNRQYVAEVKG